jgi:hypothetical protein
LRILRFNIVFIFIFILLFFFFCECWNSLPW